MIRVFTFLLLVGLLLFSGLYPTGCGKGQEIGSEDTEGTPSDDELPTEEAPGGGSGGTGSGEPEDPPTCTCASLEKDCGIIDDDGCGSLIDCGTCPAGEVCGGGGEPNLCGELGTGLLHDQFAFVSNRNGFNNIYLGNTAGETPEPLTNFSYPPPPPPPPLGFDPIPRVPAFSPGGTKLSYSMFGTIEGELHFDLSRLTIADALSNPPAEFDPWLDDGGETIKGGALSWNPKDGSAVFVSQADPPLPAGSCGLVLKKVDLTDKVTEELSNPILLPDEDGDPMTENEDWEYGKLSISPVTDPDDPIFQKIVFALNRGEGEYDLYLKSSGDPFLSNLTQLTGPPLLNDKLGAAWDATWDERSPSFLPDGKKIVFSVKAGPSAEQVWIGDLDPSFTLKNLEELTTTGVNTDPCFTKNGNILFVSNRDGNREIYTMKLDGTEQTNLINDPAEDRDVACGPTIILQP